jgi:peroxiredoxin
MRWIGIVLGLVVVAQAAHADPRPGLNEARRPLVTPDLKGGDVDGSGLSGGASFDGVATGLGVGDAAPGFSLTSAGGGSVGLRDLLGRWDLVVFVADKVGLAKLEPLAGTMRSLGGVLYSISKDGSGTLTELAARDHLSYALLSDPTGQVSALFGMYDDDAAAIRPGAALVNPRGHIAGLIGGRAVSTGELDAFARQFVSGP